MEIFAQEHAVDGERVPLGGAVVVIKMVFVAMVTWMECAVQTTGGVVLFSFQQESKTESNSVEAPFEQALWIKKVILLTENLLVIIHTLK